MTYIGYGWLEPVGKNLWRTTRPIKFETRFGPVVVPMGFVFDKFSCVSDTEYSEFWFASLLHDYLRSLLVSGSAGAIDTRKKTDVVFLDEMLIQSSLVFWRLRGEQGVRKAVQAYIGLLKRSFVYYRGVRGILGAIYYWLGKAF